MLFLVGVGLVLDSADRNLLAFLFFIFFSRMGDLFNVESARFIWFTTCD